MKNNANLAKITKILKALESQKNTFKNTAKTRVARTVTKAIPKATLNYSSILFNSFTEILKSLFKYWLNKYWFLRFPIKLLTLILAPILKLYKIFSLLKYGRTLLAIIFFILGVNIDLNNLWIPTILQDFTLTWDWFSRFLNINFTTILGGLISIVESFHHFLYGIYQRHSLLENLKTDWKNTDSIIEKGESKFDETRFDEEIEEEDYDVYRYQQELVSRKTNFKELSHLKDLNDAPWYSRKWVWAVGGVVSLVIIGGVVYYFYGDMFRNNSSNGGSGGDNTIFDAEQFEQSSEVNTVEEIQIYQDTDSQNAQQAFANPMASEYNRYFQDPGPSTQPGTANTSTLPSVKREISNVDDLFSGKVESES